MLVIRFILFLSQVSATPGTSTMSKRPREEEESTSTMVTDTEAPQEDTSRAPIPKKLRIIQRVGPEVMCDVGIKDIFTEACCGRSNCQVSATGGDAAGGEC